MFDRIKKRYRVGTRRKEIGKRRVINYIMIITMTIVR